MAMRARGASVGGGGARATRLAAAGRKEGVARCRTVVGFALLAVSLLSGVGREVGSADNTGTGHWLVDQVPSLAPWPIALVLPSAWRCYLTRRTHATRNRCRRSDGVVWETAEAAAAALCPRKPATAIPQLTCFAESETLRSANHSSLKILTDPPSVTSVRSTCAQMTSPAQLTSAQLKNRVQLNHGDPSDQDEVETFSGGTGTARSPATFQSTAAYVADPLSPWNLVMGARCLCSKLAVVPLSWLLQLFVMCLLTQAAKSQRCQVDFCSNEFQKSLDENQISPGPNYQYCVVLRTYSDCLRNTARTCRGNLKYHSMTSYVQQRINEFNCSYMSVGVSSTMRPIRPSPPSYCAYKGRADFCSCGLFGDPHLLTFNKKTQTCKVLGAWPLIDNAYLAVSVTNEAVVNGSKASATSKVTVIIKRNHPCAYEKTYEAQPDNVPSAFIDGTQSSGEERSVKIREKEANRHIEISIKYIATTIVVRQVGRYLTFTIRMPQDVAKLGEHMDGLQLCVKGCPATELIDSRKPPVGPSDELMSREQATAKCKELNITNFYLESCIFDLIMTGDTSFRDAANDAMKEVFQQNPSAPPPADRTTSPPLIKNPSREVLMISPSGGSGTSAAVTYSVNARNSVQWMLLVLFVMILTNR